MSKHKVILAIVFIVVPIIVATPFVLIWGASQAPTEDNEDNLVWTEPEWADNGHPDPENLVQIVWEWEDGSDLTWIKP